jgi:polyhydroxybutyrate depolymerase
MIGCAIRSIAFMKPRYFPCTAILVLCLALLACRLSPGSTSQTTGESTHTLIHDGIERSYIQHVPLSLDGNQPAALVFVFHGGTGNAQSAVRMSGFNAVAEREGFIVVYPNGSGRLADDKLLTWNAGNCCGYAQEQEIDDVGFIRQVVDELEAGMKIDPRRIYAAGLSNGAMLAQRLGCEASDIFAAIAPVAGTLNYAQCDPVKPISVIEFHGTADQHVPYDGGYGPKSLVQVDFASVQETIGFWRAFDGCHTISQSEAAADVHLETWTGCTGSTAVELFTIIGGGHAWPGGEAGWAGADPPTGSINATELIWEFFKAHLKP